MSKKRIIFVNPWIYDFTAYNLWARPLGLLYLIEIVKKYTEDTEIIFFDMLDIYDEELRAKYKFPKPKPDGRGKFYRELIKKPDVAKNVPRNFSRYGFPIELAASKLKRIGKVDIAIFTSMMTYWYMGVKDSVQIVREINKPDAVILGGIFPTLLYEFSKKEIDADIVVEGKGENIILDVLSDLGIRIKGKPFFENIDTLPYPAFYMQKVISYVPFLTSIGCPFNCPYCATKVLSSKFFQRNPDLMVKELSFYKSRYKVYNVVFYDDALLINKKRRLFPLLEKLKKRELEFNFHTPNGIHIREIDEEIAKVLKESKFKTVRLSLETAVFKEEKELSPKDAIENFDRAVFSLLQAGYKKSDIEVYILFGHPLQSYETIKRSIDFLKNYGVQIRLSYFSPIPKTKTYEKLIDDGIIKEDDDPLVQNKIVFLYERGPLTIDEIKDLKDYVFNVNRENLENENS